MTQHQIDLQHKRDKRKHQRRLAANPDYYKDAYQAIKHSLATRFSDYKKRATTVKKIPFNLTKKQFGNITSRPCANCGEFTHGTNFCGIDRKNPKLGYTLKNCVPCCMTCNYAKHTQTQEEFVTSTVARYNYFKRTGQAK